MAQVPFSHNVSQVTKFFQRLLQHGHFHSESVGFIHVEKWISYSKRVKSRQKSRSRGRADVLSVRAVQNEPIRGQEVHVRCENLRVVVANIVVTFENVAGNLFCFLITPIVWHNDE